MRWVLNTIGVLLVLAGCVWILQGAGMLPGSFMSGLMRWAFNGGIAAVIGIVLLIIVNRRRKNTP